MARKNDVIIQEPPMEEFGKKHSCIKRTCLSGCGCVVLFILGIMFLVHFASQDRTKELAYIPKSVETSLPLYDTQNVRTIKFTNAKQKNLATDIAGFIPKLLLSPLVISFPEKFIETTQFKQGQTHLENIKTFLKRPLEQKKDMVVLEWTNLSANPKFVEEYYINEFKKQNYRVDQTSKTGTATQILFEKNDIQGALYIQDMSANKEGTDYVSLTVNLHVQN